MGVSQVRSWSRWRGFGAILWAFITKIDKFYGKLTFEIPPRRTLGGGGASIASIFAITARAREESDLALLGRPRSHCTRVQGSGFRVQGSGFRVQGSGFRVQGSGFRVQGAGCSPGFRVQGSGFRVQGSRARGVSLGAAWEASIPLHQGSGFRVQGPGFGVQGSGFRVQGSGSRVQSRVQGSGYRVQGTGYSPGFRVQGTRARGVSLGAAWEASIPLHVSAHDLQSVSRSEAGPTSSLRVEAKDERCLRSVCLGAAREASIPLHVHHQVV